MRKIIFLMTFTILFMLSCDDLTVKPPDFSLRVNNIFGQTISVHVSSNYYIDIEPNMKTEYKKIDAGDHYVFIKDSSSNDYEQCGLIELEGNGKKNLL